VALASINDFGVLGDVSGDRRRVDNAVGIDTDHVSALTLRWLENGRMLGRTNDD